MSGAGPGGWGSGKVMGRREEDTQVQIEILRRLLPEHKLRAAFELYDFARTRVLAVLREQYPGLNRDELQDKLRERFAL